MSLVGMIGQLAGSETGAAMGSMDQAQAMALIKASVDAYGKINVPKLQNLMLQQNKNTNLAGIKEDPKYRTQQDAADAQLDDVIRSGGLTLADKAALNAIRNRTAQTESAGRHAIESGMASRGTLDSGAQLAMELQGNQQSANTLAAADESQAAQAQQRAFNAIRERASRASEGSDRDYRRQSDAARAQDAIGAGNTAIANTALMHNSGLAQQDFQNQLTLTSARTQPNQNLAAAYAGAAKDKQQQGQAIGNAVAAGANAFGKGGSSSNTGGGYDAAATGNLPSDSTVDNSFANANANEFEPYPGSSGGELQGESTRTDGQEIIGYDAQGRPIYGHKQAQGSNF